MPVRVHVEGSVAGVELVLDGKTAGLLSGPSWTADLDLGTDIAPHELVARALAPDGTELARTRQWLNLPRPPAEVEIILERGADGSASRARFSWESLTGEEPTSVRASFNGNRLAVSKDRVVALPRYEPEQVQLLTLELDFDNDVRARKDIVLGGGTGEQAQSELTAVPTRARSDSQPLTASMLRGSLKFHDRPLSVAAVEEGVGTLVVVRDSSGARGLGSRGRELPSPIAVHADLELDQQSIVRFLWPRPAAYPGSGIPVQLFPSSREHFASEGGLRWLLTHLVNPRPEPREPQFADAVAVAGLNAYGTFRRRAVLLLLQGDARDASQYSPEAVRAFLHLLRVPLFVWSIGPVKGWTGAFDVSSDHQLREAFAKLKTELEGQRIVWVEGRILPQEVLLADPSGPVELVR